MGGGRNYTHAAVKNVSLRIFCGLRPGQTVASDNWKQKIYSAGKKIRPTEYIGRARKHIKMSYRSSRGNSLLFSMHSFALQMRNECIVLLFLFLLNRQRCAADAGSNGEHNDNGKDHPYLQAAFFSSIRVGRR